MSITFPKRLFISLHFAKNCMKIDQGRAELQYVKCCRGQNQKLLNSIDCIGVKKGVKCAVRLDQC